MDRFSYISERFGVWFPWTLLALLAALTFWLDSIVQPRSIPQAGAVKHDPDYIVYGLSAIRMDAQGEIKHKLLAEKMTHYPDDDMTFLVNPHLVTYAEDRAPVSIVSQQARMSSNGENVYFEQQVRVVRAAHGIEGELVLETDYLHVIPDENVAKTDQPVTLRSGSAVVTASALELNGETRVLKLQGRVKSTFDPAQAPARNVR